MLTSTQYSNRRSGLDICKVQFYEEQRNKFRKNENIPGEKKKGENWDSTFLWTPHLEWCHWCWR